VSGLGAAGSEHLKAEGTPAAAVNARDVVVTGCGLWQCLSADGADPRKGARQAFADVGCVQGTLRLLTRFHGATADGAPDHPGTAAARTSRPPFWRPRWMLPSYGSGPTWTAS